MSREYLIFPFVFKAGFSCCSFLLSTFRWGDAGVKPYRGKSNDGYESLPDDSSAAEFNSNVAASFGLDKGKEIKEHYSLDNRKGTVNIHAFFVSKSCEKFFNTILNRVT